MNNSRMTGEAEKEQEQKRNVRCKMNERISIKQSILVNRTEATGMNSSGPKGELVQTSPHKNKPTRPQQFRQNNKQTAQYSGFPFIPLNSFFTFFSILHKE